MSCPQWLTDEASACQRRRHGFSPSVRNLPWWSKWEPTPAFSPGKSCGQRAWQAIVHGVTRRAGHNLVGSTNKANARKPVQSSPTYRNKTELQGEQEKRYLSPTQFYSMKNIKTATKTLRQKKNYNTWGFRGAFR